MRHPNGEEVFFTDESWKLVTSPPAVRSGTINFRRVPPWLLRHAKLYMARLWLGQGKAPGSLEGVMTVCQYASFAMREFEGSSLADLTPAHVQQLHDRLLNRWTRGQEALAEEAQKNGGRAIAPRRRRQVLRSVRGFGADTMIRVVRHMNRILKVARADGVITRYQFRKPAGVKLPPLRMLGAAPLKVLTEDELAAVIDAAQADIDEYHQARREISECCERANWEVVLDCDEWEMFARFFGYAGHEAATLQAIAAALDSDVNTVFNRVRTTCKRLLGEAEGSRIVERQKSASSTRTVLRLTPAEQEAAFAEVRHALAGVDPAAMERLRGGDRYRRIPTIQMWLGFGYELAADLQQVERALGLANTSASWLTRQWGPRVFGDDWPRVRAARAKLDWAYPRAIKASALQLLAVSFRRVSAPLLSLPSEPLMRRVMHREEAFVGIHVTSFKMWGDEGLGEWVELPGFHGEVLEKAVQTAKTLTAPLRRYLDPEFGDLLFIVPEASGSYSSAVPLASSLLHTYVYSNTHPGDLGILRRRNVPRAEEISVHFFRHTHLTVVGAGGGSPRIAARLAGNSPEMAGTAYMAQGTPPMRVATKKAFEVGAVSGYLLDAVLRVAMEATGEIDDSFPASQLSLDEALKRIRQNPQILPDYLQGERNPTPEMALALLTNGDLVLNLHSKGACILPASEGPCPAADDCPIGCDPERNAQDPTCGCRWLVKVARDDVIESYRADIAAQEELRAAFARERGYETWAEDIGRRIQIYTAQLEVLVSLRSRLPEPSFHA